MNHCTEHIARILRVDKNVITDLEAKLNKATGKVGVFEEIYNENEKLLDNRLEVLGLSYQSSASEVYNALISKVRADDIRLFEAVGIFSLRVPDAAEKIAEFVSRVHKPKKGFFLKKEKAAQLLAAEPPKKILAALGYKNVRAMLEKEDLLEVFSALRFLEDAEWLNKVFFKQYENLRPDDFEERSTELRALSPRWIKAAEKFVAKKYHNVSHLKEMGVIFIIPIFSGIPGETLRLTSLLLHYLSEVEYYSELFQEYRNDEKNFARNIISLLRGDVLEKRTPELLVGSENPRFLVVQRYLAKDDENDWRLFEPHINPEAEHWLKVSEDLGRLSRMLPKDGNIGLGYWTGLDYVGDFFKDQNGQEQLVSFDLTDLIMSLVKKGQIKYLYHQQEALWNKIFSEYEGRERMNELIEENIIKGFIEL